MAIQTTYSANIRAAIAGARANMEPVDLISRTVQDVAGVGFGKIVQQGTLDNGCTADLTGMTAQTFLGITMLDRGTRPETPDKFAQYESARIMRKGVIWVQVGEAVTPASIPTVTLATGVIGDTAVGAGVVAIPGARFDTSASANGLAQLVLG